MIAILGLCTIIVITILTFCGFKNFGYLFWATECVSLSGLVLYVPLLTFTGQGSCKALAEKLDCFFNCIKAKKKEGHDKTRD